MEKRCWKCKQTKDISEFYKDSYAKDKHQAACKICTQEYTRQYQLTHPTYFTEKGKLRYQTIGKHENKERYAKDREKYKRYRREYGRSLVGKLKGLLNSARGRAKKHQLIFDLDIDWLMEQHKKQDGKCSLTGIPFKFDFNYDLSRHFIPDSPSLDRINPVAGYTKENTRLVCTAINIAMNSFGEEFFTLLCEAYLKHRITN